MALNKHPLEDIGLNIKNIKCFNDEGSDEFHFSPMTFIIGKNNSGKSTILDVLERVCRFEKGNSFGDISRSEKPPVVEISAKIAKDLLSKQFPTNVSGQVPGRTLAEFGKRFHEGKLRWQLDRDQKASLIGSTVPEWNYNSDVTTRLQRCFRHPTEGKWSLRIQAERNVIPEKKDASRKLSGNGEGLTNLVRAFINSDNLPRHVVERDLLQDLNKIYLGDSDFTQIVCQENENTDIWEIFLREESKGDVRLSQSGSSLKTAFIVTAFLRLLPLISDKQDMKDLVFCLEEPENNLHPALLRRLLEFLADRQNRTGFSLVVTTHSPICIDWAAKREDSTILHVRKEDDRTVCQNVLDYGDRKSILDDLDVRGSDILQANGIVWIEGPSDRVYIRKWIELVSNGMLREGSHYSFLYYGGKVLSHFEALPEAEMNEKINMLLINRNVAVVMDSDRQPNPGKDRKPRTKLNSTKRRLIKEVNQLGGFSWITSGKEIENYVPNWVWERVVKSSLKIENEYVNIPALGKVKALHSTKVDLAHAAEQFIVLEAVEGHLDLRDQLDELCNHINTWNGNKKSVSPAL